jgi:cephalosporin hydroxylase
MSGSSDEFLKDVQDNVAGLAADARVASLSRDWLEATARHKYSYNFSWLGRPIIQYPQDIIALQEIIWRTQPEIIIETGVAHGGSLIFYASMMELIGGQRHVIGIDIEIRPHNRVAIEAHPMSRGISLIQGSSTDPGVILQVSERAQGKRTMVVLDSNHSEGHVLSELEAYSPYVSKGCYLVVLDTIIEHLPRDFFPAKPWGPGNNSKTAVDMFLRNCDRFVADHFIDNKLQLTVAPGGYLACVKD